MRLDRYEVIQERCFILYMALRTSPSSPIERERAMAK